MRFIRLIHARPGRSFVVFFTLLIFVTLLVIDAQRSFTRIPGNISPNMLRFGFSMFVVLAFLAVGTIVWLFARERWVAFLLFCFSFTMMMAFTLQTGAQSGDPVLSAISDSGASMSLTLFATLLLFFPVNHYATSHKLATQSEEIPHARLRFKGLRGYLLLIWGLCVLVIVATEFYYLSQTPFPLWSNVISDIYNLTVLTGIIVTIIITYRRKSSSRERQQLRFFVVGVLASVAPLLILTVLPQLLAAFGLPATPYIVDSQISTLTVILLPTAFGYSILRYQILAFDRYIQRIVSWTMGVIFLAILGYGAGVICNLLFLRSPVIYNGVLISSLVILAPVSWWLAGIITERLFFGEMRHYRQLIDKPDALTREMLDINQATELLTMAAVSAFETNEICLFVYDRESGHFQLTPPLLEDDKRDTARQRLAKQLMWAIHPDGVREEHSAVPSLQNAHWIKADQLLLRNVNTAKRPLFLSEALKPEQEQPTGLSRFISTSTEVNDPLLAAVHIQGEMIGLLALGERGDHGQYAGPDFEAIDLLLARYSPVLENARLYEQANRHGAMLNALYGSNVSLKRSYQTISEVARAYAAVAADTAKSGVDIWLTSGGILKYIDHVGDGPRLPDTNAPQESDWHAWFYEGTSSSSWHGPSTDVPSCLHQTPCYPFAWLPLEQEEQRLGVLALTYPRPHLFSEEEKSLWSMFASQCAAAIENAQADIDLREAYERQKELDQLKNQFIITASHELRTPLTAVQGYIDLLQSYDDRLTPQARADFIAKAGRGCDELTLIVNNIMDASRAQEEAVEVELSPIILAEPITQVLEMMDAIITRENRQVTMAITPDIVVKAEEQRLKQIILNLVGNALKYSPPGTPLEISAYPDDGLSAEQGLCSLHVRDYGSGVPPEEQQRLFERFVRLERDMNSPVRGAGLGLFICKQLAHAMGGNIRVESSGIEGEGSDFLVTLKLHRPAQIPVQ